MRCSCGERPAPNEFMCQSCLDKEAEALLSYQHSLLKQQKDEVDQELELRWESFILAHPSLASYIPLNVSKVQKHVEFMTMANAYSKTYNVTLNNQGIGVRLIGDYSSDTRLYALYLLKRILKKYISREQGLVSVDYVNCQDVISDVFLSPADNFYSTTTLLVLDGVDLPMIQESKMELKAFYSFVKYRLDQSLPTFMIVHNASNKMPDNLKAYMQNAFLKNTILLKDLDA